MDKHEITEQDERAEYPVLGDDHREPRCQPGVSWQVSSETEWRQKWIGKLGEAEFERRLAIAKAKVEEFRKVAEFEEVCVIGTQFEALIMQLGQAAADKFAGVPPRRLANFVYKLAGV